MKITDALGNPIGYVPITMAENTDSAPIVIIVNPEAGDALRASIDASASALARIAGSGGAWTNLGTNPIDLAPYAGGSVSFEIIARAGDISGLVRANLFVGVTSGAPAGWGV